MPKMKKDGKGWRYLRDEQGNRIAIANFAFAGICVSASDRAPWVTLSREQTETLIAQLQEFMAATAGVKAES